jgi:hypothetical protein
MVTAKFKVSNVNDFGAYRQVFLHPVYSSDKTSPNYSWSQATPSGKMEMTITNPGAFEQFAVGKTYLMTFDEVAE